MKTIFTFYNYNKSNYTLLKTFLSIYDVNPKNKTIVTIGTFDGVHQGHKKIIEKLNSSKKDCNCETLLLTFFPHPRMVLQSDLEIKLLNTIDEKVKLLEEAGLDNVIIHPFDHDFSRLTAEKFIKSVLVNQFNVKKIIVGYDHRFGRNRTAAYDDLVSFGKLFNFEVEQISVQEIDAVSISSTKIRNALLKDGNVSLANEYLGYNYFITGKVIKGKKIGRTIGFPTANIYIKEEYKLIPKNGVYVVTSKINNQQFNGMMNIGYNPTFNGELKSIEVHFFNFNQDIYNQEIQVEILERIRDEQKFDTIEDLKAQLEKDKIFSLNYFNS